MPLPVETDRNMVVPPEGTFAVFPIDTQGREHYWNINCDKFLDYKSKGYIKFGRPTKNGVPIMFLTSGEIKKLKTVHIRLMATLRTALSFLQMKYAI